MKKLILISCLLFNCADYSEVDLDLTLQDGKQFQFKKCTIKINESLLWRADKVEVEQYNRKTGVTTSLTTRKSEIKEMKIRIHVGDKEEKK